MVNHKEILRLKHLGLTNREIADAAGCGRNTVTRTLPFAKLSTHVRPLARLLTLRAVFFP